MYNENKIDPISSKEKSIIPKVIAFSCLLLFLMFGSIFVILNSLTNYIDAEYVVLNRVQIPTMYKYTKYDDIFITRKVSGLLLGDVFGGYVVLFCNSEIPKEYKEIYVKELEKIEYNHVVYNGTDFYVKNIDNNTKFIYIMLSDAQIKYGLCTTGRYEDILK